MRILMVIDTPWDRTLGAPRVQMELAEQFRARGHEVDVFSLDEAYSRPALIPELSGSTRNFPRRAAAHIRRNAHRYDVVDARHGSITATKQALGFDGLLVTRSTGLLPIYDREFLAEERRSGHRKARLLLRPLRRFEREILTRRSSLAFRRSDLINVLNTDEERFCRAELGAGDKTVKLLHGLTRERMQDFVDAQRPSEVRQQRPQVAFVGGWGRRKGSADMASIVRTVRAALPQTGFTFLGTGVGRSDVLAALGADPDGIDVREHFGSEELPSLLASAAVGMLPSYVEGFPFSIIEMLAAGLPVAAYDAPGARETLPLIDPSLLVGRGDAPALGRRLVDLLMSPDYPSCSRACTEFASGLRWEEIADATLGHYAERLAMVRGAGGDSLLRGAELHASQSQSLR
jgi:glycosyltransferase involved in cell wall biosynthesis